MCLFFHIYKYLRPKRLHTNNRFLSRFTGVFFECSKDHFDLLCKMQAPHRAQAKAVQGWASAHHEQGNPENGKAPQNRLWWKKQVSGNREKTEQKSDFHRRMRCLQAKKNLFIRNAHEETRIGVKPL